MITGVGRDRIHPSGGMMIALSVIAILTLIRVAGGTPPDHAMFAHSEWEEFRVGFQEVSEDLEGWYEGARHLGRTDLQVMIARSIARWATDEELLEVYRFRSGFFAEIADDPSRNPACAFDGLWNDQARYPGQFPEAMTPYLRVAGRSMARMHTEATPWEPELDLLDAERAWQDFVDHFDGQGLDYVIDALLQEEEGEGDIDRESQCLVQATLYGETAARPNLPIGDGRLLDFVRDLEILGTEEG